VRKLLIAGIDPGTVAAFAVIDTNSNLIHVYSKREMDHNLLTKEISKHGNVFLIGCDVSKCPETVTRVASSLGADVVNPDHDLRNIEKIKIVDKFLKTKKDFIKIKNKHERDALAAALYGLKRVNTLIKKINDHLEKEDKLYLFEEVKEKVLVDKIPITKVLDGFR